MKYKHHQNGDKRTRRKFAWFPIMIDNGYSYWLQWVTITEEYHWHPGYSGYWKTISAVIPE